MTDEPMTPEDQAAAERGRLLVAEAAGGVSAPLTLQTRVAEHVAAAKAREAGGASAARRPSPRARLRLPALGAIAAAGLAAVLAAVLVVGGGGPSVTDAAQAAVVDGPPPAARGEVLAAAQDGVDFPNWEGIGWRAQGAGDAEAGGRDLRTVSYRSTKTGAVVQYSIVAGDRLDDPDGARTIERDGTTYRLLTDDGRRVVTWTRDGRTCIVAGPTTVADEKYLELATWEKANLPA